MPPLIEANEQGGSDGRRPDSLEFLLKKADRLQRFYWILDKDRRLVRFKFNRIQQLIYERAIKTPVIRHFDLKYRQGGVSTFWLLWWLDDTIFHKNTVSGILADSWQSLGYLWHIVRLAFSRLPTALQPRLGDDSKTVLSFPQLNSRIFISLGIKATALHNLHISEWAFCSDDAIAETLAACGRSTNISGETTSNGPGGDAHRTYIEGKEGINGYDVLFVPWWEQDEYRLALNGTPIVRAKGEKKLDFLGDEQLFWRRRTKIKQGKNFFRNFPENDVECWLDPSGSFFDSPKILILLNDAKKVEPIRATDEFVMWEKPTEKCSYVAGADVAEGKDKTDSGAESNRDYSVLAILCTEHKQAAFRYRARIGVDVFAKVCAEWGVKYNNALLAVEKNNHGIGVIMGLALLHKYRNLYRPSLERRLVRVEYNKLITEGWETNKATKTVILDRLKLAVEGSSEYDENEFESEMYIPDVGFLEEALSVVEKGDKIEAKAGCHDDIVIAYAIAYRMYEVAGRFAKAYDPKAIRFGNSLESATDKGKEDY